MKVVENKPNFSSESYELHIGETALERRPFKDRKHRRSLSYSDIRDFYILFDRRGRASFTMFCGGKMYEGQILEPNLIEPFVLALSDKLDSFISIEVRKN